jgi:hypothetical protein
MSKLGGLNILPGWTSCPPVTTLLQEMNTQVPLRFGIKLPSESIVILPYRQDALKQDRIRSGCSSEKSSSGRVAAALPGVQPTAALTAQHKYVQVIHKALPVHGAAVSR